MSRTPIFLTLAAMLAVPRVALASDSATATVIVTATFGSRTSLAVSTNVLRFDVANPEQPASGSVEFAANARTPAGSDVVLSFEPLRAVEGPDGLADESASLTFEGIGEGTLGGVVTPAAPTIAGRWSGSGRWNGRFLFALRAGRRGSYTVPFRLVLSTP